MKLQAIETKSRSNFDTMIIGMNAARKGISTPQQNAATLAIAQEFQANALARADFDLYSSFTELFNSLFEDKTDSQEPEQEGNNTQTVDRKRNGQRKGDFLSFTVPHSAATRMIEQLRTDADTLVDVAYKLDVPRMAQEYSVTESTVTIYLKHFNTQRYLNIQREDNEYYLLPNSDDLRHYLEGQIPAQSKTTIYDGLSIKASVDKYIDTNFTAAWRTTSYERIANAIGAESTGTVRVRVGELVADGVCARRVSPGQVGLIQLRKLSK